MLRGRGHTGVHMAPPTGQLAAVPAVEVEFRLPGIAFVTLRGEHDLSSKHHLTEALTAASAKRDVLVDLSDCTFMDSSVIGALFRAHQSLAEDGGRLELVIPESATTVKRVADATLLAAMLPIHETRRAAIARIRTGEHTVRIRDLRLRFGDTESHAAECSCGWTGETRTRWQTAAREARRDGAVHVDEHRV
ncbi:MAG: anti-sigma factor antagonist [Gaiellales bacterium]|nr:anti-sigma factor antagonist [Gaiellales bacterium]